MWTSWVYLDKVTGYEVTRKIHLRLIACHFGSALSKKMLKRGDLGISGEAFRKIDACVAKLTFTLASFYTSAKNICNNSDTVSQCILMNLRYCSLACNTQFSIFIRQRHRDMATCIITHTNWAFYSSEWTLNSFVGSRHLLDYVVSTSHALYSVTAPQRPVLSIPTKLSDQVSIRTTCLSARASFPLGLIDFSVWSIESRCERKTDK